MKVTLENVTDYGFDVKVTNVTMDKELLELILIYVTDKMDNYYDANGLSDIGYGINPTESPELSGFIHVIWNEDCLMPANEILEEDVKGWFKQLMKRMLEQLTDNSKSLKWQVYKSEKLYYL